MLQVVADAGFAVERSARDGVIEATMRIEPTTAYLAHTDRRDHVGAAASLRRFLEPASVAVYGASPRRGTVGGELFRNVLAAGFHLARRLPRRVFVTARLLASRICGNPAARIGARADATLEGRA